MTPIDKLILFVAGMLLGFMLGSPGFIAWLKSFPQPKKNLISNLPEVFDGDMVKNPICVDGLYLVHMWSRPECSGRPKGLFLAFEIADMTALFEIQTEQQLQDLVGGLLEASPWDEKWDEKEPAS